MLLQFLRIHLNCYDNYDRCAKNHHDVMCSFYLNLTSQKLHKSRCPKTRHCEKMLTFVKKLRFYYCKITLRFKKLFGIALRVRWKTSADNPLNIFGILQLIDIT